MGFFLWNPAAWLRVAGPDAAAFLQGQFTNDLRALDQQRAVYGLWLTVKGKVVADSFVLRGRTPEEFWIGSYASTSAAIRERLESHIIADDVVVEDATRDWSAASLWGEAAGVVAAGTPGELVFPGRRARPANMEWIFPAAQGEDARRRLSSIPEIDSDTVARWRIEAGIPLVPVDVGLGDLPSEGGLEGGAISYQKGCYLGQEVMARLKSMGQIRRRLLRVRGAQGTVPPLPAPLYLGGAMVGDLRSAARDGDGFIGLAMISRLKVGSDAGLAFAPDGPLTIRLVDAP